MSKVHCGPFPSAAGDGLILTHSGRLSLYQGCSLHLLACLRLSLQPCFPSFINATVAEVLIFQFNLTSAASNDLMINTFPGICSFISKLFSVFLICTHFLLRLILDSPPCFYYTCCKCLLLCSEVVLTYFMLS